MQHRHNKKDLKYVTQTQQQRPESLRVTLTWHACKHKVHKLHQRCIPKRDNSVIVWRKVPKSDAESVDKPLFFFQRKSSRQSWPSQRTRQPRNSGSWWKVTTLPASCLRASRWWTSSTSPSCSDSVKLWAIRTSGHGETRNQGDADFVPGDGHVINMTHILPIICFDNNKLFVSWDGLGANSYVRILDGFFWRRHHFLSHYERIY